MLCYFDIHEQWNLKKSAFLVSNSNVAFFMAIMWIITNEGKQEQIMQLWISFFSNTEKMQTKEII